MEYRIICGKSEEKLKTIKNGVIDLVITSPPYNVKLGNNKFNKNPYDLYNDNKDHQEYINWLKHIFSTIKLKLKKGGRVCINIGDGKNGMVPTHSDIIQFMTKDLKFIPMANIIWNKSQIGNRFSWGSFQSPSAPSFPKPFEYIMVFAKDNRKLQWKGETDLTKKEFIDWSLALWNIAPETRMKKIGHPACVDNQTECLTNRGWKKYNELKKEDLIASYNIKKEKMEWDTIKDITRYEHNDKVISVKGRRINMLLNKNHNCIISKNYKTKTKPEIRKVKADELKRKDVIPCSMPWVDNDSCNNVKINKNIAELLGWFITEGNYVRHKNKNIYTIQICQSLTKNAEKVKEIEKILISLKAEYKKYSSEKKHSYDKTKKFTIITFCIKGKIRDNILKLTNSKKSIPSNILLWEKDILEKFFFAMIKGDGHYRKNSKSFSFIQYDYNTLSLMQAIGVRLGYDSYLSKKNNYVEFNKRKKKHLRNSKNSLIKEKHYKGIMWCPQVEKNGTFVARRKGHIFITGNCFPVAIPYRLIKMLSWKNSLILDPFNGAGSTGVACKKLDRNYIGIEMSQEYCDKSVKRIEGIEEDIFIKKNNAFDIKNVFKSD